MSIPTPKTIKKTQITTAQAVTANRLSDGAVVYLTDQNTWSAEIDDCQIVNDQGVAENFLSLTQELSGGLSGGDQVVGTYLFKVQLDGGRALPLSRREIIRTTGPSISFGATAAPKQPQI